MSKAKLLLIIPPQKGLLKGFATGIVSLAEYLALKSDEIDIDIEILDFSLFTEEEILISAYEHCHRERLIVGITTTTASYQPSLTVARSFKKTKSDTIVIMGGQS